MCMLNTFLSVSISLCYLLSFTYSFAATVTADWIVELTPLRWALYNRLGISNIHAILNKMLGDGRVDADDVDCRRLRVSRQRVLGGLRSDVYFQVDKDGAANVDIRIHSEPIV